MLKPLAAVVASVLISSAVVQADPTTLPTTQPMQVGDGRVLVLPFAPVKPGDSDWIGRSIQQSMVADLSRPFNGRPLQATTDSVVANNVDDAINEGRKMGASYVVIGSYLLVEPNLKLTGQVIDVASGRVIGGVKSTGSTRELFDMQDTAAAQVRYAVAGPIAPPTNTTSAQNTQAPAVAQPQVAALGPVEIGESRYDGSDLAVAVQNNESLITTKDAAGTSYRNNYYDNSYYNSVYNNGGYPLIYGTDNFYGGGWWGGGWGYGGGGYRNPHYRCDPPRHRDGPITLPQVGVGNRGESMLRSSSSPSSVPFGSISAGPRGFTGVGTIPSVGRSAGRR